MDIKKTFAQSVVTLTKRREIILPFFAVGMLVLLLGTLFLFATGLQPVLYQLSELTNSFNEQYTPSTKENFMITLFNRPGPESKVEFAQYLEQNNFTFDAFVDLVTPLNVFLFIAFILVAVIIQFYASIMTSVLLIDAIKNKTRTMHELRSTATYYSWRYLWLVILKNIILFLPLFIVGLIIYLCFAINQLLGIASLLLLVLYFLYLIIVTLRFFFASAILFFEDTSVITALKKSYTTTGPIIKYTALIALINIVIYLVIGNIISKSIMELVGKILLTPLGIVTVFLIPAIIFLLLINAIIPSFTRLFIFTSYPTKKKRRL